MRLEEKIENITRVIGKPLEMFREKMGRINIISRIRWKQLSSNLASQFVQPLTLDTYEDSKDVLVETPNEVYALADYAVMSNSFAVNNPNWIMPSVNNDGTMGLNNFGVDQIRFSLDELNVSNENNNFGGYPLGTTMAVILANDVGNGSLTTALTNGYRGLLAFGDVFYIKDNGNAQFIKANTGQSVLPLDRDGSPNLYGGGVCSAPGSAFCIVIGKPLNYNENDPSTWFHQGVLSGNPSNGLFFGNVPLVGEYRPYLYMFNNNEVTPIGPVINNDPNINITIGVYPDFVTLSKYQQLNFTANFLQIALQELQNPKPTRGPIIIPLCSPREHVLTFKTQDHYEFSFPPKMVQPYANINFNAEIDDTFMRFIKYTGNPDVVKSVPINMGYQVSYIGRAVQRITCVSALTTAFDNYQLNLGAIAIYSPSNSSITF